MSEASHCVRGQTSYLVATDIGVGTYFAPGLNAIPTHAWGFVTSAVTLDWPGSCVKFVGTEPKARRDGFDCTSSHASLVVRVP